MDPIFIHSITKSGRRFTICGLPDGDKLKIGLAICNPRDQFCKRIGRNIAEGRANNTKYYFWLSDDYKINIQIVQECVEEISEEWKYPFKVK